MKLYPVLGGRHPIAALGEDDGQCEVMAFLEHLEPAAKKSLLNVFRLHVEHAPITNEQKSRLLRDGIFEFKTKQGIRVCYFYDHAGVAVLTNGFKKGAVLKQQVEKAESLRAQWNDR